MRPLLQAFLLYLLIQVVAIGAGLTVSALSDSGRAGFLVSNAGAVIGVVVGLRHYLRHRNWS